VRLIARTFRTAATMAVSVVFAAKGHFSTVLHAQIRYVAGGLHHQK